MILKGDRSLDAFCLKVMGDILSVLDSKESTYLIKPIGVKDDLRRGVRNIQKDQEGDSQRRQES